MIKLNRIPYDQINTNGGHCKITSKTNEIILEYNSNPDDYNSGTSKFDINSVYSHENIKSKLKYIQKNKCAFCEVNLYSQHGDVEHFRPKRMYKQDPLDIGHYPGYYWLSYSWENLLLSCITCNQKWKKNLFPIMNPDKRALNHNFDINEEKPVFINPYNENPSDYIKFKGPLAQGIDDENRGKLTIKYFKLNRNGENGINSIFELRKGIFDKLNCNYECLNSITIDNPLYDKIIACIEKAKEQNEEYSAMVIDNFPI